MGQYHAAASIDKGEALYSHPMGDGLKLMEQGWGGPGGTMCALALFIAPGGRWHGDHIVIVGDYAEPGDLPEGTPFAEDPSALYAAMHNDDDAVTRAAKAMCGEAFGCSYRGDPGWDDRGFDPERIAKVYADIEDDRTFGPLYVVDLDTKQYLDPLAFGCGRNLGAIACRQAGVMLALAILLAVSNGRGGGDFNDNEDTDKLVGSWGAHRVVLGAKPEDGVDLSERVQTLIDAGEGSEGEWAPRHHGGWATPGSLPQWLEKVL